MKNTLNVVVIKYRDTGELRDWKRSGHLRKTTPCDDNTIRWIVMHFRRSSCTKIKACLHSKGVPDISISTVSWHLSKGFGLKSYKPAHKKRLEFAKRHQLWTAQNWNPMPFSDESTVHQFILRETHVRWVKGSMSKRFDEKYTVSTMRFCRVRWYGYYVSIWYSFIILFAERHYHDWSSLCGNAMWQAGSSYTNMHVHRCAVFMHDGDQRQYRTTMPQIKDNTGLPEEEQHTHARQDR